MSTTINGVARYKTLAEQLLTSFVNADDFGAGRGQYEYVEVLHAANTSIATVNAVAPVTGKLVGAFAVASVTSDATKTYTLKVENESNTSADMVPSALYDADPVLTANTVTQLTLSTTAANLACTRGDLLACEHTGGTGSGTVSLVLVFVANS